MSKFNYRYVDPTLAENACIDSGSLPYRTHMGDNHFCSESVDVSKYVSRRLGHPTMQLEMNSGSIYAMFEESINEYSQHINSFNMKNWLWEHVGNTNRLSGSDWATAGATGSIPDHSHSMGTGINEPTSPNMGSAIILSEQYGQAAGVGGKATLQSGSIILSASSQDYDLNHWSQTSGSHGTLNLSEDRIVVQRVYNEMPAAITRYYDPYTGAYDQRQMLDQFGFGAYSPATTFIMRPISYDLLRASTIETSDRVRKSAYSFEIINNTLRIWPLPDSGDDGSVVWIEYYVRNQANAVTQSFTNNKVSDPSNAPYKFIEYSSINAHGRQWIRNYTLALSKELLGIIRSKYANMPIPGGEVALDGDALKTEGREEKMQLTEQLKEFLESVSLTERSKAEQEQADANQSILNKAPLQIFIG